MAVRGHAAREELKIVHRLVQPRHFAGIHGEHRHLVMHRDLAIDLGIAEDGLNIAGWMMAAP